jgi:DNA polymerase II large subunit
MNIKQYFKHIGEEIEKCYEVARAARDKGLDPVSNVEVPQATSLAEKVVGVVGILYPQFEGDTKIVNRILELEKEFGKLDPGVALTIAEELAKEKLCKFKDHGEALEAGVRVAVGYLTLGVVSSPIEGFVRVKVGKTKSGEDYLSPYYAGPIRSAGGTEAAFSLVVVDYLREVFGYVVYDPTEEEVKRGIHECYEYHERVTNLQYLPCEEELEYLMKHLPVQVAGDPSESREVYNYKDLPRVDTNFIRSGFALVMGEGIAQKAPKILKRVNKLKEQGFKLSGWDWLEDFVGLQKKLKESSDKSGGGATYIQDIVAGRPIFGHPGRSGAFRLRYGRARNTGYSTLALSPATMAITGGFIAVGTQLRIEKPTKGCTVAACDSVDGPIVKLKSGEVRKVKDVDEANEVLSEVKEIIYLGDLLVPYGDFLNRNYNLTKPAFVEQYWLELLKEAGGESSLRVDGFGEALKLSEKFKIALHPDFIFYWSQIKKSEFLALVDWIAHGEFGNKKLVLPYTKSDSERFSRGKRALEIIGCEHVVSTENVVLDSENSKALLFNLGVDIFVEGTFEEKIEKVVGKIGGIGNDEKLVGGEIINDKESVGGDLEVAAGKSGGGRKEKVEEETKEESVLELVNRLCGVEIKDKAGTFIGARMGRPEKAKLRKLIGSPHRC